MTNGIVLVSGANSTWDNYDSLVSATDLQNAVVTGGSTSLVLSDNTRITLAGVTDLTSQSFG